MRNKLILFAPFLTFVVVGCGNEPATGDTSEEALLGLDQAAMPVDTTAGNSLYYTVRPDTRKCITPLCGGWFVRRVNRATTACADGAYRAECYVATIDWAPLNLDTATLEGLTAATRRSEVVLQGTVAPLAFGRYGNLGKLIAVEAYRAPNDKAPLGPMYRVKDSGMVCIVAPCFAIRAERLNAVPPTVEAGTWLSSVNFDRTCAGEKEVALATAAIKRDWVLASGFEWEVTGAGWMNPGRELVVTQFYRHVEAAVPDNSCGGIAGRPCAGGAFCDFAVENACHGADLMGVCKPVPRMCTMVYDPVCGCNGVTYGNDCARVNAREQLAHRGACVH